MVQFRGIFSAWHRGPRQKLILLLLLFDETGYGLSFPLTDGLTQNLAVDEGGARRGGIAESRPRAAASVPRWVLHKSGIASGDTSLLF
jgi:hypothetical protein